MPCLAAVHAPAGSAARVEAIGHHPRMTEADVLSTLRVRVGTEDVHYGGRSPEHAELDRLWSRADAFRDRLATLGRTA